MLRPRGVMDKGGEVWTPCQRQMLQWLLCLLTAFSGIGVCVEQPVNTTLTLVTDTKTWSEAQMVCEMMGGYLASPDTTHKMTVFLHFLQLWKSSTWILALSNQVMIGMHNVDDTKSDPYYWPRNCSLAPKPTSLSYMISQTGGCITLTDTDYTSITCSSQLQFVCEVSRDSCSYETKMNSSVSLNLPYTVVRGSDITWCKATCDAQGIDCWAVAHSPSLDECYMYNVTSPFFFDDSSKLISNPQLNFHIKRCYEALINIEPMNWMQYDAQPLASPCSLNQSGRVYTLVTLSRTAEQARAHCHAMGHELAGPTVVSDRNLLQSIIHDLYQETYAVNQTYPLWVNFTGGLSGKSVWRNGSVVTASVTVLGSNSFQCGLLDLDSGAHYLDDCSRPHAFICMTHRPCSYIRQANVFIKGLTPMSSYIANESTCRSYCTQQRARGSTCSAYTYAFKLLIACNLYSASTTELLSSLTSDLGSQFYWWTCAYVILQANDLLGLTTTTEPGTTPLHTRDTTTTSSKTSFLTTEVASTPAPSVSETTSGHTVGRTTATPTTSTTQKTPEMETTSTTTSIKTTKEITEGQITLATTNATSPTNASNQSPTGTSASPSQPFKEITSTQTASYTTATSTMQLLQKTTFNQTVGHTTTTPTEATSLTTQKTQETISTPTSTVVTTETTKGRITSATTAVASASVVSESSLGRTSSAPETTQPVTSDFHPETEVNVTSINTTIAVDATKPWMCSCRCSPRSVRTPDAEAIALNLVVQRNATYKSRLRYVSVDDNRPSCRSIGAVAVLFMCFVAAVIVSSDCVARSK